MEDATTNDARTPHYYPSNPAGCSKVHRLFGESRRRDPPLFSRLSLFSFPLLLFFLPPSLPLLFFCIRSHRTFSLSKMALAMSSERNCGHTSASRDIRHYNGGVSRVGRFFTFLLFLPSLFLFPEGGANPSSLSVPLTASLPSSR